MSRRRNDAPDSAEVAAVSSSTIRQRWIDKQLQLRVQEFSDAKKLTVWSGTWNVGAKKPAVRPTSFVINSHYNLSPSDHI